MISLHEKNRVKIMAAGFTIYRCSQSELVVKCRSSDHSSWRILNRYKTKKSLAQASKTLLDIPDAIQD